MQTSEFQSIAKFWAPLGIVGRIFAHACAQKSRKTIDKKEAQTLHSGWISAENNYYD
jgi:hypothetical protein